MRLRALAALALFLGSAAAAQQGVDDELVVVGRYPGPPLWRVSNGSNDLWIFGTLDTIPKDMTWDSANVERVVGGAEVLLLPPGANARPPNPFKLIGMYRQARRLSRNAEDALLADVVPSDLYARYTVLRDKYIPNEDKLERQRPAIVALRLYAEAIDATGLTYGGDVQKAIERIARRARVERIDTEIKVAVPDLLAGAAELSAEAEIECFATILASIETDLPARVARARAWATGDIAGLRALDFPDIRGDCLSFAVSSARLREMLEDSSNQWLAAAENALAANQSTFATLDIRDLVGADGLLARLRERGYEIREPRSE
jgi:uncharacterized protein YbaP (TraB family)